MSARENLTLGRPDASEDDIAEAIETAQAGFVYDLPWGLDTRIGEQGMSLSGGQRQRLALARAVLAKPRILVLDDTLSALDVHTEALVETGAAPRAARGDRHRRRPPRVHGAAGRQGRAAPGRHDHPRRHPPELLATVPAYRDLLGGDADDELVAAEVGGGSMTTTASTPPAETTATQDWRGVAAEDSDDVDREGLAAAAGALAPAAGLPAAPAQADPRLAAGRGADRERRPAVDALPGQGGHRPRHPADPRRRGQPRRCSPIVGDRSWSRWSSRRSPGRCSSSCPARSGSTSC